MASASAESGSSWAASRRSVQVSRWLYTSCGVVGTIVLVGGVTRLTESGLSITQWKPLSGVVPPLTEQEWEAEFARYQQFPEFKQKPDMTLKEFQWIFFWEWFHRVLARSMGIVYGAPLIYFAARGYFRGQPRIVTYLVSFLAMGGAQGALGWYMVKSGLDDSLLQEKKKATVSAYRLAAHLSLAFAIYSGMLRVALGLRLPKLAAFKGKRVLQALARTGFAVMFTTAVSGAAVAGLDAGLLYNDGFPFMAGHIVPPVDDLFPASVQPFYRNFFENGSCAQTWHRIMAGTTIGVVAALNVVAAMHKGHLPPAVARAVLHVNAATAVQVTLGIATLLTFVEIPVAASHQAGSMALLTTLIRLCAVLGSRGVVL